MNLVINEERRQALTDFSGRLGVCFNDIGLLHRALTHTSYANEAKHSQSVHNERLEFLGDAVLELATSTYLYQHYPHLQEGQMTKARAAVVCESTLCKRAVELGIGDFLLLGRGEKATGGTDRPSILADAFEAIIGAIYLDQGWNAAQTYILRRLKNDLAEIQSDSTPQDYKTTLQEVVQRHHGQRIVYELISATGPDHAKIFRVCVRINGLAYGTGQGHSKKEAEQRAAREALPKLK